LAVYSLCGSSYSSSSMPCCSCCGCSCSWAMCDDNDASRATLASC
jgi:hypothetical protein